MKTMINLLPMSFRRRQMARKRVIQWMVVISCVLAAGWVWHLFELREETALAQQLEVLSREHRPTQTMLKQLVEMRERLCNLEQQEAIARELESQRNPLAILGVVSKTASVIKGRLRVTELQLSDFQQSAGQAAGSGSSAGSASSLALSGEALDNPAVAELLDGLQDSGLFGRVELLKMKERENGSDEMRDYQVKCEF
jgi:Tfp pilus assembly protein PilN